jgi:translation elongation factor EF-1alpha
VSERKQIGKITHYFSKIGVAVVELTGTIKVGDTILIKGAHAEFEQKVKSMQVEHESITEAGKGQSVGLKVEQKVHENDVVFK